MLVNVLAVISPLRQKAFFFYFGDFGLFFFFFSFSFYLPIVPKLFFSSLPPISTIVEASHKSSTRALLSSLSKKKEAHKN